MTESETQPRRTTICAECIYLSRGVVEFSYSAVWECTNYDLMARDFVTGDRRTEMKCEEINFGNCPGFEEA